MTSRAQVLSRRAIWPEVRCQWALEYIVLAKWFTISGLVVSRFTGLKIVQGKLNKSYK